MANSSTTTTSAGAERRKTAKADGSEIRLNGAAAATQAQEDVDKKINDFFWTYTEEPHRTRRMAIIKAHPEVCSPLSLQSSTKLHRTYILTSRSRLPGHEALRPRAIDQIRRRLRRRPAADLRLHSAGYVLLVMEVLGAGLCCRRDRQPEPLPRYSRNLAQPGLPLATGQQARCHLCESAHWRSVQRFVQGIPSPPTRLH